MVRLDGGNMSYRNKFSLIIISAVLVCYTVVGGLLGRGVGQEGAYSQLAIFNEVLAKIKGSYVENPDLSKVMHGALLGLLESLDPYCTYLTAEEYARYQISRTSGDGEIGLELSKEKMLGYIYVIHPIEEGSSERAGVQSGDVIEAIEGVNTQDVSLVQAGYLLSGEIGSEVKLKILRRGRSDPLEISVVREKIKISPVRNRLIKKQIGYLRVSRFVKGVGKELRSNLKAVISQGADRLILDLRNCGGNEFDEGIEVANLFLDHGVIAYSEGQQSEKKEFTADPDKVISKLPLVVLQNYGSASAAEIVSVAIKENQRGEIVGVRSFGKAVIQRIIPLDGQSAVLLSVAKFYSQSGQVIQNKGIIPDYEVPGDLDVRMVFPRDPGAEEVKPPREDKDIQLQKAIELLTKPLEQERKTA